VSTRTAPRFRLAKTVINEAKKGDRNASRSRYLHHLQYYKLKSTQLTCNRNTFLPHSLITSVKKQTKILVSFMKRRSFAV